MRQGVSRRGAVLIVVMGVLFVLALLATTFASIQGIERKVARNYLDGVRAKQVARAGVEVAYSRLLDALNSGQLGQPAFLKSLKYYGSDVTEAGNPALMETPLELARNPSLAVEVVGGNPLGAIESPQNPMNADVTPRNIYLRHPMNPTPIQVGFSGLMESGAYGAHADMFSLSVRDASSMIYVNDGVTESQTQGSVTKNLRRILNHLGDAIGVAALGDRVITSRPAFGYKTKRELQSVLGTTDYRKAAPFLTTHAWVDKKVPNPVPLSGHPSVLAYYNSFYPGSTIGSTMFYRGSPPVFRFGVNKNAAGIVTPTQLQMTGGVGLAAPGSLAHAIYGYDQLFPMWIEMTSRAPVNLNSAPREVVAALLSNVHGFWLQERRRDSAPSMLTTGQRANTSVWNKIAYSYDSGYVQGTPDGDELGFLCTSDPVKPPPNTGPNSALAIADEMIACRDKTVSPGSGFNYGNATAAPFAGPFKSWRQFYMFIDHLVDLGVIVDTRSGLYTYYGYPAGDRFGNVAAGSYVPMSSIAWMNNLYRRLGSQAIADAIKANFNPNLHLNEANPDENMNLMIDKTDLIVMSTEGTFVPNGYYEIESLGRVVRPQTVGGDAFTATTPGSACELVSEYKVEAVVKLYEAVRFTTQRDFYGYGPSSPGKPSDPPGPNYWVHTAAVRTSLPYTNNALSIEIGPEPDQGVAPEQCDWGGYIAWPTNYGDFSSAPGMSLPPKPPGTFSDMSSAAGGAGSCNSGISGCVFHAHFTKSDYLYHHILSPAECRNLARFSNPNEVNNCWPDPLPAPVGGSEVAIGMSPAPGPYDPFRPEPGVWMPGWGDIPAWSVSGSGNRHRLARHFRVPPAAGSGTSVLPNFTMGVTAPLDMRIDGVFLERHSTLAYWMTGAALVEGSQEYQMLLSYWIKPKYYPEMSGRIREYFNWSKRDPRADILSVLFIQGSYAPEASDPWQFAHYFCPSQRPDVENWTFPAFSGPYTSANHKMWQGSAFASYYPIRPCSMIFLNWESFLTRPPNPGPSCCYAGVSNCGTTPTLNHHLHNSAADVPSINYPGCLPAMPKRRRNSASGASPNQNQPYYLMRNPLACGRWMHWIWYHRGGYTMDGTPFTSGIYYATPNGNPYRRILINGVGHSSAATPWGVATETHDCAYSNANYLNSSAFPHPLFDWSFHHAGMEDCGCPFGPNSAETTAALATGQIYTSQRNLIRIGENDQWAPMLPAPYEGGIAQGLSAMGNPATRNFPPDATIDEFYFIRSTKATNNQEAQKTAIVNQYGQGRYHLPRNAAEGRYDSPKFNLPGSSGLRVLPPPSTIAVPSGYSAVAPPSIVAVGNSGLSIIGVSWTWFGEDVDIATPNLDPVLTDYRTVAAGPWGAVAGVPQVIKPRVDTSLYIDGVWTPTVSNDWFSPIQMPGGAPWSVLSPNDLRFRFKFNWIGYLDAYARVHATPYIDDITIYFAGGDVGFVDYHMA